MRALPLAWLLSAVPAAAQPAAPASAQPAAPVAVSSVSVRSQAADLEADTRTRVRLLGIELGSGLETDLDLLEPYMPTGLDRFFAWDFRIGIREDSFVLKGNYRHPGPFQKFSTRLRVRADTYGMLGVGKARDWVYDTFTGDPPGKKTGFSLGVTAVRSHFWGFGAEYDELRAHDPFFPSLSQRTSATAGWTPLGENKGHRWNWTLVTNVGYEEHWRTDPADPGYDEGFGVSVGPVYQHALKWVRIPWVHDAHPRDRVGLDRFKTQLMVAESEIGPLNFDAQFDVTAYATDHLKMSAGAGVNYVPKDGGIEGRFLTGLSLRFSVADLGL